MWIPVGPSAPLYGIFACLWPGFSSKICSTFQTFTSFFLPPSTVTPCFTIQLTDGLTLYFRGRIEGNMSDFFSDPSPHLQTYPCLHLHFLSSGHRRGNNSKMLVFKGHLCSPDHYYFNYPFISFLLISVLALTFFVLK